MFNRGPSDRDRERGAGVDANARLRAALTMGKDAESQPPLPVVVPVPSAFEPEAVANVARHPLDAAMELTRAAMAAVDRLQAKATEAEAAAAARQKEMEQEISLLNERLRLLLADNARKEERLRQQQIDAVRDAEERKALEGALRNMLGSLLSERGMSRAATENLTRTRAWLADFERKAELVLAAFPAPARTTKKT